MGRQRDPKRDEAKELYMAANGEVTLIDIAAKLGVSDGTVRGWKAKDKWENLLTGKKAGIERSDPKKAKRNGMPSIPNEDEEEGDGEVDELFIDAVRMVTEAKQTSVSLLQRRMRIGYSRAARLIDAMERKKLVGPYKGDRPREVYATLDTIEVLEQERNSSPKKRNAPKKVLERSVNKERSIAPKIVVKEPEPELPEVPDDEGLTPKNRIFVMEYLRDFNATRAAIAAGYSKKTAYSIGWELLRKPEIKAAIARHTEEITSGLGLGIQRVIAEYMKIAFADITDFVNFGKDDMPLFNKEGNPVLRDDGSQMTQAVSYVDFKNDYEIDGTVISEVKQGMKALKELEKYLGYMSEVDQLKVQKLRLEVDKLQNGDGDSDESLINDWVSGVMDDEQGEELDETT